MALKNNPIATTLTQIGKLVSIKGVFFIDDTLTITNEINMIDFVIHTNIKKLS